MKHLSEKNSSLYLYRNKKQCSNSFGCRIFLLVNPEDEEIQEDEDYNESGGISGANNKKSTKVNLTFVSKVLNEN